MHYFQPRDLWTPPGFVRPVPVDPTGQHGPTKAQARGPHWRRTGRNQYVPAHVDATVAEQRIVEAATQAVNQGAVTGWARLRLSGGRYFDGLRQDGSPRKVQLLMGPGNGRRKRDGVTFLYDRLEPTTTVRGITCVPAQRAVFDEVRSHRLLSDAVVALDMAVLSQFTSLRQMTQYVDAHAGWPGVPMAREALLLADQHSASPPEVRLRLFWERVLRLPRPKVNVGVFDQKGRFVGYPDLLDEEAGLVIEYDGSDHSPEKRRSKDVDREGAFRDLGLEVIHVFRQDMRDRTLLAERLINARRRSRFESAAVRRWTIRPERARYCPWSCSCRAEQRVGQYPAR